MTRRAEIKAADDLEILIPEMKQLVSDLREGKGQAYSRVYYFRRMISQIVASLGSGSPERVHNE